MTNKLFRYFPLAVLAVWCIVSLAALAGMYKLWWEREKVSYLGKSVEVQRSAVVRNAGLSESLLHVYNFIDKNWPRDINYRATGDHNQLSYIKYLLIPRIPGGATDYSVDARGSYAPVATDGLPVEQQTDGRASILALFVSLFIFSGMALFLKSWLKKIPFSFPEMFGCILLSCMGSVVLSRIVFATAVPAFYLLTLIGMLSWGWLFLWRNGCKRAKFAFALSAVHVGKDSLSGFSKIRQGFLLLIIALGIFWAWLMAVIVVPDDWDAWAIWAAKAKVLALGRGPLLDVSYFGHADYPLLWPAIWAFSGWLGGGWEEMWSRGWGGVFLLLCAWEIFVIIDRLSGRRDLGLFGGALFVSMPMVPLIASWSYAEAPFWLLLLACCGSLTLREKEDSHVITLVAALLAAAAAYTKNEGVMFAGIAGLWISLLPGRNKIQTMLLFFGIFVLCYAPWVVWTKHVMHFGSHATSGLHFDFESIQRAGQRTPAAIEAITKMWVDIRQWNIVLWLGCTFAVLGMRKGGPWRVWLFPPLMMLLGYFVIVIFHEAEIYWQVGTSWNRLTVHFLPFLIIAMILQWVSMPYSEFKGDDVLSFKSRV